MESPFLSAPEMEQIVSLHWICFDAENSAFGAERPKPHRSEGEEIDVDGFVRFRLVSVDTELYLSCYEVWEKIYNPFGAYLSESLDDRPKLYEYQGKDYYVRPCDIPVSERTCDSLHSMLCLLKSKLWEKNAFLRILLDQDISNIPEEYESKPEKLQEDYQDAVMRHEPSRRFFSSDEC